MTDTTPTRQPGGQDSTPTHPFRDPETGVTARALELVERFAGVRRT